MPRVRGGADKWQSRSQNATGDYAAGVADPRVKWDEATLAAAPAYEAGVAKAIANKSFNRGVKTAGHDYWQQQTQKLGPNRYAEGVRNGAANYTEGFEPYRQVIESIQLQPRGPRNSQVNYERSNKMGSALAAKRDQLKKG